MRSITDAAFSLPPRLLARQADSVSVKASKRLSFCASKIIGLNGTMVGFGTVGVIARSVGIGSAGACVGSDVSFEQLTDAIAKTDINIKIANRLSNIRNPAPVEDHHLEIMIRELTNREIKFFDTVNFSWQSIAGDGI